LATGDAATEGGQPDGETHFNTIGAILFRDEDHGAAGEDNLAGASHLDRATFAGAADVGALVRFRLWLWPPGSSVAPWTPVPWTPAPWTPAPWASVAAIAASLGTVWAGGAIALVSGAVGRDRELAINKIPDGDLADRRSGGVAGQGEDFRRHPHAAGTGGSEGIRLGMVDPQVELIELVPPPFNVAVALVALAVEAIKLLG